MARFATFVPSWTTAAIADTANLTDNNHHTVQGGNSTQRVELRELYIAGLAAASAPNIMMYGRHSTVGATLTAARFAWLDPSSSDITGTGNPKPYIAATTDPQRSATLGGLVNGSLNAYGGEMRWVNGPDEIVSLLGNTASLGELGLSAFTGSTAALVSTNIIMEVV